MPVMQMIMHGAGQSSSAHKVMLDAQSSFREPNCHISFSLPYQSAFTSSKFHCQCLLVRMHDTMVWEEPGRWSNSSGGKACCCSPDSPIVTATPMLSGTRHRCGNSTASLFALEHGYRSFCPDNSFPCMRNTPQNHFGSGEKSSSRS